MHRHIDIYSSKNDIKVMYEPHSKKYLFFRNGKMPYFGIAATSISFLIIATLGFYIPDHTMGYIPYPNHEPSFLFFNFTYSYNKHFSAIGLFALLNIAAMVQALIWHYSFKIGRNYTAVKENTINATYEINSAIYELIDMYRLKTVAGLKKFIKLDIMMLIIVYLAGLLMFYFTYTDNELYTWDILLFEPLFTIELFAITFSAYIETIPRLKLLNVWACKHSEANGKIISPYK